jgi:hypothetical protein
MKSKPHLLTCLVLLLVVDVALRVFGYARVMRVAQRIANSHTQSPKQTDASIADDVLRQIIGATALYPGRSECLEQSVCAYLLLRRRGLPVLLRLGVQPYPFAAHAWVELNGAPVTESNEVVSKFAVLPDLAL